ncbi:MAG TPA: hypothetical protein VF817_02170, partial [Patescibacteria group bacterium]
LNINKINMKAFFKRNAKKTGYVFGIVISATVIGFSLQLARAGWTPPPAGVAAPASNVGAPITTNGGQTIKSVNNTANGVLSFQTPDNNRSLFNYWFDSSGQPMAWVGEQMGANRYFQIQALGSTNSILLNGAPVSIGDSLSVGGSGQPYFAIYADATNNGTNVNGINYGVYSVAKNGGAGVLGTANSDTTTNPRPIPGIGVRGISDGAGTGVSAYGGVGVDATGISYGLTAYATAGYGISAYGANGFPDVVIYNGGLKITPPRNMANSPHPTCDSNNIGLLVTNDEVLPGFNSKITTLYMCANHCDSYDSSTGQCFTYALGWVPISPSVYGP